jgi:glycosyltransferase involved in cell wall biosynthesis
LALQKLSFSFIIPVYNRPQEVDELLGSLVGQDFNLSFEVIIVEDGSTVRADDVVAYYKDKLAVKYFYKENSGPGLSRNEGIQKAKGSYFIILDSDVILPSHYLSAVAETLKNNYTDAFGGPDKAHPSFTVIQKAINYSMTSVLTTGGLRGHKKNRQFQPRSFNMGLSKRAFEKTGGFAKQRIGEDIDLCFRLWQNSFETQFIEKAFVYHKRRSNFEQFFNQVYSFGRARPILNKQHKNTAKATYWLPSFFLVGFVMSLLVFPFSKILTALYTLYLLLVLMDSLLKNKDVLVGFLSVYTTLIQMFGYGLGFLLSQFKLRILGKSAQETFPEMFV